MAHFTSDVDAVVIGSYKDQYGGRGDNQYTLYLKGEGQCSWYYEEQLTLISHDGETELAKWKAERLAEGRTKGSSEWIFANGPAILHEAHPATVASLAKDLGLSVDDLWGAHGEGISYWTNAMKVLGLAEPYLRSGDASGWMAFAAEAKGKVRLADFVIGGGIGG
jgi:hypothetical protein